MNLRGKTHIFVHPVASLREFSFQDYQCYSNGAYEYIARLEFVMPDYDEIKFIIRAGPIAIMYSDP